MPFSFIDLLVFVVLAVCLVYGWNTGLLRQCVAVSAAIFGVMTSNIVYEWLGAWWAAAGGIVPPTYLDALAYLLLYLLAAALWLLVMRRVYPYTRLAANEVGSWVWSLDRFGGLFVGTLLGAILALSVVGAIELQAYYRWGGQPGARGVRDIIHAQVIGSAVVQELFQGPPELTEFVTYWIPGLRIARGGTILP